MARSDGNGNFILKKTEFYLGVAILVLSILGVAYGWGCEITGLKGAVEKNTEARVETRDSLREINETLALLNNNVGILLERTDPSLR